MHTVVTAINNKKKKKVDQAIDEGKLKQQDIQKYDVLVCFTDGNNAIYKDITHVKACEDVMMYTFYQGFEVAAIININEVRNIDIEVCL